MRTTRKAGTFSEQEFFETLFDVNEEIAVCQAVHSCGLSLRDERNRGEFFIINPLKNGRKDEHVSSYRNLVFEMDNCSLKDQLVLIERKIKLPYSTLVFSGNKSFHWIISLEIPLVEKKTYDFLFQWIFNIIEIADPQTKNPSRLSRYPEVIRKDSHKLQRLVYVHGRVNNDELMTWLEKYPQHMPTMKRADKIHSHGSGSKDRAGIVELVDWYVHQYLGQFYRSHVTHVQCPICASEGADTGKDNMSVTGDDRLFKCWAVEEHNSELLKFLHALKREHASSKSKITNHG